MDGPTDHGPAGRTPSPHPSVAVIDAVLRSVTAPMAGSLHVHCTDADGEWYAEPAGGGVVVTREHRKGDAVLRGPAEEIAATLRAGAPTGAVEGLGDPAVLAAWLAAVSG